MNDGHVIVCHGGEINYLRRTSNGDLIVILANLRERRKEMKSVVVDIQRLDQTVTLVTDKIVGWIKDDSTDRAVLKIFLSGIGEPIAMFFGASYTDRDAAEKKIRKAIKSRENVSEPIIRKAVEE